MTNSYINYHKLVAEVCKNTKEEFIKTINKTPNPKFYGRQALRDAVNANNSDIVDYILHDLEGNKFIDSSSDGILLIHTVRNRKIAKMLLEITQYIDDGDDDFHRTPLMFAVRDKCVEMVEFLLENGANINKQDINGNTVLHWTLSADMIPIFKKYSFEQYYKSNFGQSVDKLLKNMFKYTYNGLINIIHSYIDNNKFFNIKNNNGQTALHFNISEKNEDLIKSLANEIDIECVDNYNRTVLQYAAETATLTQIQALVKCGANVKIKDHINQNLLHYSRDNKYAYSFITYLVKQGVNVNELNKFGLSPLEQTLLMIRNIYTDGNINFTNVNELIRNGARIINNYFQVFESLGNNINGKIAAFLVVLNIDCDNIVNVYKDIQRLGIDISILNFNDKNIKQIIMESSNNELKALM